MGLLRHIVTMRNGFKQLLLVSVRSIDAIPSIARPDIESKPMPCSDSVGGERSRSLTCFSEDQGPCIEVWLERCCQTWLLLQLICWKDT